MDVQELATIVTNGFKELSARMGDGFAKVDRRFEQVDQRFAQIDQRFGRFERRLNRVESGFVDVTMTMSDINSRLVMLRLEVQVIDGKLVKLDARVASFEQLIRDTHVAIEGLHTSMKMWAEGQDVVREKLDRHIAESDQRYESLESMIRNFRS